jgi:hypothetical protein
VDPTGRIRYAFIHGNYALDNARPDGRWCGVNDELTVLIETGCYADFTLPSAPNPTQTRTTNAVYFATDDPQRPRSHDTGQLAQVGREPAADSMLIIPGALALNFRRRRWGLRPRLENSELLHNNPPTIERLRACAQMQIGVRGRPDWIIVKLHTHGAVERNAEILLDGAGIAFHQRLESFAAERGWHIHYMCAREVANVVCAAIDGHTGNPNAYRDYRYRLRRAVQNTVTSYQAPSDTTTQ